jgi:hypothetical protein
MRKTTSAARKKGKTRVRVARKRIPGVPPADSKIWPEQYRGKNWKPAYGLLFAGKCQLCAYSCPLPESRQLLDKWYGVARLLLCTNHPASPGSVQEVLPTDTCRNFKGKSWQPPRAKAAPASPAAMPDESDPMIRRIRVGSTLFAIVDACDYKKLSKYRWYPYRTRHRVYAVAHPDGKTVYMHRLIMRPRKGYVVDHIDGNGLNNRRCNLRVCTHQQNLANMGPRGSSRFAGVRRHKGRWQAQITCRGKFHYLGLFDDEVEAARVRDRKAYELNGEHAYINRPEDLRRWLRQQRRAVTLVHR